MFPFEEKEWQTWSTRDILSISSFSPVCLSVSVSVSRDEDNQILVTIHDVLLHVMRRGKREYVYEVYYIRLLCLYLLPQTRQQKIEPGSIKGRREDREEKIEREEKRGENGKFLPLQKMMSEKKLRQDYKLCLIASSSRLKFLQFLSSLFGVSLYSCCLSRYLSLKMM